MESMSRAITPPRRMSALVVALASAAAWYLLLGHDPASWVIGVPCIALAALASQYLVGSKPSQVSLIGWSRLVVYFLHRSLAGGWDVARRVLSPALPLDPGYVAFELHIPGGPGRTFFVQFIGLLPGTLGVWLEQDTLLVHVLDLSDSPESSLRDAELRVAEAFALTWGDSA